MVTSPNSVVAMLCREVMETGRSYIWSATPFDDRPSGQTESDLDRMNNLDFKDSNSKPSGTFVAQVYLFEFVPTEKHWLFFIRNDTNFFLSFLFFLRAIKVRHRTVAVARKKRCQTQSIITKTPNCFLNNQVA